MGGSDVPRLAMPPGPRPHPLAPATLDMLFLELASAHRLRFLAELRRAPRGASQLAKLSGLSVQEAMRHLRRLQDLRLVQRRGDREYLLTPLGEAICREFPSCEALLRSADFVLGHDLAWVPGHLSAAPLLAAPRSSGVESENILAHEHVVQQSARFLLRASDQLFWHAPAMARAAPGGRDWRAVYTPSVVTNERFLDLPRIAAEARGDAPQGRWRICLVRELPVMVTVTEHEAALFLRDAHGRLDFREMVRSAEPAFRDWAGALFHHLEQRGVVVFDTARGDTAEDWRAAMLDGAQRLAALPR